jgi:hypothetical protein
LGARTARNAELVDPPIRTTEKRLKIAVDSRFANYCCFDILSIPSWLVETNAIRSALTTH